MLHGTVIVVPLITAVPPKLPGGVPAGQPAPSTVACWRKPSSVKPWIPVGGTENVGVPSTGSLNGATAFTGGLAVPPETAPPPPPPGPLAAFVGPTPRASTSRLSSATRSGVRERRN